MKNLKIIIATVAIASFIACKKDNKQENTKANNLKYEYRTDYSSVDSTFINFSSTEQIIKENVILPVVSQDGGTIIASDGINYGQTAFLQIVTAKGSSGII